MDTHSASVEKVRSRIQHFYQTKTPFRIYHGSTNSTRHANFDQDAIVDVSSLNHILSINQDKQTALVEPNVSMDVLLRETTKAGLLPPVVMEFPGITVGGGFVGTAGESSSFKYGFFDRTAIAAEVVLADGSLVNVSTLENPDLFEGLRGSFGTLGVLTMLEIQLIPLKPFVKVTYHPVTSFELAMAEVQSQTANPENDYVDGILFSKGSGVIVSGKLVEANSSPRLRIRRFLRSWDEWFYIHAGSLARKGTITQELVPIEDYLLRYDRGAFWMGIYGYKHFMVPFIWLTRFLLNYFMHTRIMYHALHASGLTDRYIIQDIALPAKNTAPFVKFIDRAFRIYPLWLCPLRKDGRSSMGHPNPYISAEEDDNGAVYDGDFINVGIWGPCASSEAEYVHANRSIEAKMRDLGGLKWLYSRVFYTEDEWWQVYDRLKYEELRHKFNAASLPTIWDKVKDRGWRENNDSGLRGVLKKIIGRSQLLSGLYGIYKALLGGDYMLRKKKTA